MQMEDMLGLEIRAFSYYMNKTQTLLCDNFLEFCKFKIRDYEHFKFKAYIHFFSFLK
jgi:hypothetical protein